MGDLPRPSSRAAYLLSLSSVKGVGPWTAVAAIRAFPDPSALFGASPAEREEVLKRRFAGRLASLTTDQWPSLLERGEAQVREHARRDIRVVAIDDDAYPPLMQLAPNPAAILYVRGALGALATDETVAVIGTRAPTPDGATVARRLAGRLCEAGFTVVSGLAKGIDAAAHEGALDAHGTTVAVLGTAIDRVYPAANRPLAERIVAGGGALVSEYPAGFATSGRHFVERDRLQAALSIGVVAIQTGTEGGTLHTVRFATEARRPVIVPRPLPNESDHAMYGGIHELIGRGHVVVLDGQDDYPRLFAYLRSHRDWLRDTTKPLPSFDAEVTGAPTEPSEDRQQSLGF